MFDELNSAFPNHSHFYEVNGLGLAEAMESCARIAAGDPHILNYNGKIIFAVQHAISVEGIDWLLEVAGAPVDTITAIDDSTTEEVVNDTEEVVTASNPKSK